MAEHIDVEIPAEGVTLRGALFLPDDPAPSNPAITLANGLGALRNTIYSFARKFAENGFVTLAHDHRNFGGSEGTPRHDIDPWQQVADWRRAISFLESRPEVDSDRIGLWGTSYAGGHAITLGGTDRRLKAVVSQVPLISGFQDYQRRVLPEDHSILEQEYSEDERAQLRGEAPRMVRLVDTDPGVPALYHAADIASAYLDTIPEGVEWHNQLTLRSIRKLRMYEPGSYIARVSPTPLLMVVAAHDNMAPVDLALRAYESALEPKQLEVVDGTHFTPYRADFDQSSNAALNWFRRHLA